MSDWNSSQEQPLWDCMPVEEVIFGGCVAVNPCNDVKPCCKRWALKGVGAAAKERDYSMELGGGGWVQGGGAIRCFVVWIRIFVGGACIRYLEE